jgi:6-phosphogluconolactonase/glucosamine-6-phosphate isomerase/deaminase
LNDGAGNVCLALGSGGSLVKLLGGLKGRAGVEWGKWHVFWVDERQGLTLVHFSAHHNRLLWDALGDVMESQ